MQDLLYEHIEFFEHMDALHISFTLRILAAEACCIWTIVTHTASYCMPATDTRSCRLQAISSALTLQKSDIIASLLSEQLTRAADMQDIHGIHTI